MARLVAGYDLEQDGLAHGAVEARVGIEPTYGALHSPALAVRDPRPCSTLWGDQLTLRLAEPWMAPELAVTTIEPRPVVEISPDS